MQGNNYCKQIVSSRLGMLDYEVELEKDKDS